MDWASRIVIILFLLSMVGLISLGIIETTNQQKCNDISMDYVIDGDTFYSERLDKNVRLAGIDAPEKGTKGAKEATELLASFKGVDLCVVWNKPKYGHYNRPLAWLFAGGRLVNMELLADTRTIIY